MRKFLITLIFILLAAFVAIASYHVAAGIFVRWTGFENLRFMPSFVKKQSWPLASLGDNAEKPRQNTPRQSYDIDPKADEQKFIDTVFSQLGAFEKIEGSWHVKGKRVTSEGDIVYRSDKYKMTLRFTNASFEWDADKPEIMHNPVIENLEVTSAWPMVDPYFAELDSLWELSGSLEIQSGRLKLVNILNENVEIINTPFAPIKLEIDSQQTGRILDNIVIAFYNLSVAIMLETNIELTKTIGEKLLAYMVGMPVTIGKLEGDLSQGQLIFENILLGEENNPLLQFSQGKMTYQLDKSELKRTKVHITGLSLFDPVAYVRFFPKEGEANALSQSLIPVVNRLIDQGRDISLFEDQLYAAITFREVNIGEGFVELRQDDQAMRTQISPVKMDIGHVSRTRQYTASQSYGLLSSYLARLSETAGIIYMDQAQQAQTEQNNNSPQEANAAPVAQQQGLSTLSQPTAPIDVQPQNGGSLEGLNLQF